MRSALSLVDLTFGLQFGITGNLPGSKFLAYIRLSDAGMGA
jgi:hypothetical protein